MKIKIFKKYLFALELKGIDFVIDETFKDPDLCEIEIINFNEFTFTKFFFAGGHYFRENI
jgi:hypothetical protein